MIPPEERWDGEHGHLYDDFHKCEHCRFYSSDPEVVAKHEEHCDGESHQWCDGCRFDCQNVEELIQHHRSNDCVWEISAITQPLFELNYDVLDRAEPKEGKCQK
jgi:hypothetical protein